MRQEWTDLQAVLEAKQSNRAWRDKVKAVLASAVKQAGCPCSLYSELMSASAATLSQYVYINWSSSALWSQSNIWCTSKIWFILFVPMCIVCVYIWEPDLYAPHKRALSARCLDLPILSQWSILIYYLVQIATLGLWTIGRLYISSLVSVALVLSVDIEFSSPYRGHTQQVGRIHSMEQIRLASAQGWSILRNPPETYQSIGPAIDKERKLISN